MLTRLSSSPTSSRLTSDRATAVAVFLWTSLPRVDLPLTITYGTSILRQSAGSHTTSSIGSTSWAMTTRRAFLFSTSQVIWLIPYFRLTGFVLPVPSEAYLVRRSFFSALLSGLYFFRSRMSELVWGLSRVDENWARGGGTFNRFRITDLYRWMRM